MVDVARFKERLLIFLFDKGPLYKFITTALIEINMINIKDTTLERAGFFGIHLLYGVKREMNTFFPPFYVFFVNC